MTKKQVTHQDAIAKASSEIYHGDVFTSIILVNGQWQQFCLQYTGIETMIDGHAIIGVIDFAGDYFSLNTRYVDPSTIRVRPEFAGFFQDIVELEVEPEPLPAPSLFTQLFNKVLNRA